MIIQIGKTSRHSNENPSAGTPDLSARPTLVQQGQRSPSDLFCINTDRISSFYVHVTPSALLSLSSRQVFARHFLVVSPTTKQSSEATSSATTSTVLLSSVVVRVRSGRSIACLSAKHVLRVGTSLVVGDGTARHTATGRDVVVGLSSLVRILSNSIAIRRVDDHDHALLAVLGLRTVDVDGLVVGNRNHEHGSVACLAVLIPVLALASSPVGSRCSTAIRASIRVSRDRLEIGEDSIPLRLARVVRS